MKRTRCRRERICVAHRRLITWMALASTVLLETEDARGGETTLSEPIIEENITDIDAAKVGTLEVDVTGVLLRPHHSKFEGVWTTGLEAEWRPLDRLGIGAEFSTAGAVDGYSPKSPSAYGPRAAASYVILRDFPRRIFLQAETSARYDGGHDPVFPNLTESALPYTFGVRWATQLGPVTLRAGAMGEAGGTYAHAPVRGSSAVLLKFGGSPAQFYVGAEVMADWARTSPFLAVPEALLLTQLFGKPVRMGVGVPLTVGAKGSDGSVGIAFRCVVEPDE